MVAKNVEKNLDTAADAIASRQRQFLSTPYPPASTPGESPHRRSGDLKSNVQVVKPGPLVRQIGSNTPYAAFLEVGTSKMAPRPWALKSLMESQQDIQMAFGQQEESDITEAISAFVEVGE